jgi:hypothetical protein
VRRIAAAVAAIALSLGLAACDGQPGYYDPGPVVIVQHDYSGPQVHLHIVVPRRAAPAYRPPPRTSYRR